MNVKSLYIVFLFFAFYQGLHCQNISDLQSKKSSIQKEIEQSSALLEKYKSQKSKALVNIKLLDKQILSRQNLIDIYTTEINWLNDDIQALKDEIEKAGRDLNDLKRSYEKLIRKTYENRKIYNDLSFFLGAQGFNEAYRRFILYREYNKFRKNQGLLIQQKTLDLESKKKILETKLTVQQNAYQKVMHEKSELEKSKKQLNRSVTNLKQKEGSLRRQIRKQQNALKELERAIVRLIKSSESTTYSFSEFGKAVGKLKWPVASGVIISRFGKHQHPVLKYVQVDNNGVDIQSSDDVNCKAVFDGVVSRIVTIPGYNNTVIVRHGKFLTVYANLQSVNVKKGETVKSGQVIGKIYSGEGENSKVLHFEIWEENQKLDPEKWLYY